METEPLIKIKMNVSKAKYLIDELTRRKAQGDKGLMSKIRVKLILKGVMVNDITDTTPDTDEILALIHEVANDFNVSLPKI